MGCRRRRADLMAATGLDTPMEHRPLKPGADTREHLVVIGTGMAGCRAVEELLARDPNRYRVTIFGAEPRVNYTRIMLSPVLAGAKSRSEERRAGKECVSTCRTRWSQKQ